MIPFSILPELKPQVAQKRAATTPDNPLFTEQKDHMALRSSSSVRTPRIP